MAALIEGSLPGANEKARAAADGPSRTFSCKADVAKIASVVPTTADQLISVSPCVGE